jgi:hypothetical protein
MQPGGSSKAVSEKIKGRTDTLGERTGPQAAMVGTVVTVGN